jgi:hypothetical protein
LFEIVYVPVDEAIWIPLQALIVPLFVTVVMVLEEIFNVPPIAPTVSIAVIVVPTYDKIFFSVLPVTVAFVRPFSQIPFVYTVFAGVV